MAQAGYANAIEVKGAFIFLADYADQFIISNSNIGFIGPLLLLWAASILKSTL